MLTVLIITTSIVATVYSTSNSISNSTECQWGFNVTFNNNDNQVVAERNCEEKNISSVFDFRLASVIIDDNVEPERLNGGWDTKKHEQGKIQNKLSSTTQDGHTIEWDYEFFEVETVNDSNSTSNSSISHYGTVKFGITTKNVLYQDRLEICFSMMTDTNNKQHFDLDDISANHTGLDIEDHLHLFYEDVSDETDYSMVTIGEYLVDNDLIAQCERADGDYNISVNVYSRHNFSSYERDIISVGVQICYEFDECQGGNIVYDPFVYYEGEEPAGAPAIFSYIRMISMYSLIWILYAINN